MDTVGELMKGMRASLLMNKILPKTCLAAWTSDEELRLDSSSGGVFTELAKVILADGGVVFGAAWEKGTFRVVHKWVEKEVDLSELRGSKYSVSDLSGVYEAIRKFLSEKRQVLFVGTPCQTAAIRSVFGDDHNLFLCALMCMANAEPKLWLDYVRELETQAGSRIVSVCHRQKQKGRESSFIDIRFLDEGKRLMEPLYSNVYWKKFCANPRIVCQKCLFRSGRNRADLQIGDFWGIEKVLPGVDRSLGVSAILVYTGKGSRLIAGTNLISREVQYQNVLAGNPYLERQYCPAKTGRPSLHQRCRSFVGKILSRLGLR